MTNGFPYSNSINTYIGNLQLLDRAHIPQSSISKLLFKMLYKVFNLVMACLIQLEICFITLSLIIYFNTNFWSYSRTVGLHILQLLSGYG